MANIYLFDWGNTLMVDFPVQNGKMCEWRDVQAVDGASELLAKLVKHSDIYIATNAADSSSNEIKAAFDRVDLAQYIDGYFCKANLGIGKGTPEFFHRILKELNVCASSVTMIGDSFDDDIAPALSVGIQAIWLNTNSINLPLSDSIVQVKRLKDICFYVELSHAKL
ncbi:HAD family hydrolase [Vibrio sinensis]|uniref:HAD family hydrolase n=1 Tax=Vibrio sinensis TaxID=2302434 RepID=A0A3A6QLE5_9VIBR|nr:HAD family hydrolase [Vibrio sinensis]RJX67157.1 HAD family hydrolase [Vibrio sinensis]